MNIEDIAIFAKVIEHKNFSAAAKLLRLPKSTVSRRISLLEERLGVKLLSRTTRKLSVTPIGQVYYEKCTEILDRLDEANGIIKGLQTSPKGRLRVTIPHELGIFFLKDTITGFLKVYPEIILELEFTNRIIDLVEEGFDVGLRIGKLSDSSLTAVKVGTIRGGIYASPDFLEGYPLPRHPLELQPKDCVQFRTAQVYSWIFRHPQNGNFEIKPKGRLQVNSMQYICESAVAGLGIAAINRIIALPYVQQGNLIEMLQDYELSFADIFAVYPSRKFLSPNVRAFIDYVKPRLARLLE